MKTKILDAVQYGTCILGITLQQMDDLLSIILSGISIVLCLISGFLTIGLKIKHILSDGKITEEEIKDLKDTVDNVKKEIGDKDERQHK